MSKTKYIFALFGAFVLASVPVNAQDVTVSGYPAEARATQAFEVFNGGGSYLGVQTQEVNKENFSKFGLKDVRGVAIEKVVADSPAQKAGLQDNDVIVRFNGEEVTSYRKLTRLISETAPDHQAKITVLRDGKERDVTVTVGKQPAPQFRTGNLMPTLPRQAITIPAMPSFNVESFPRITNGEVMIFDGKEGGNFVFGSTRQLGVGISGLTKQLGDYFGVADGKGILINNVNDDSPASKAGLKAGDVIIEVEGKAVGNSMELLRAISEKKEGEVALTVLRNRNRQTIKVTPEKLKEGEMPVRVTGRSSLAPARTVPGVRIAPSVRTTAPVRLNSLKRVL